MRVNLLTDYKNNNQKRFEMSKRLYVLIGMVQNVDVYH